jgi:hypothetical protein
MLKPLILGAALLALTVGPAATASAASHSTKAAASHPTKKGKADLASVKRLGGTGPWSSYLDDAAGGKICYLIGKAKKVGGGSGKAEDVRLSVTHRPADKVTNVINFLLGFRAKKGSDATLDVDGHKFSLFTDKDGAWTRDSATDRAVVNALGHGISAKIEAKPEHGAAVTDTYDLTGFTAALTLIDKACGIRR